jgi:hypothetical protein
MKNTSYQLLKDVHEVVARIEDKVDKRFAAVEVRVNKVEDFQSNLTGKITVLGGIMMLLVNFLWDFGRGLIKKIT